jgi:hypothetical protein
MIHLNKKLWLIGDWETYPNCALLVMKIIGTDLTFSFEISGFRDDRDALYSLLCWMRDNHAIFCGFNIVGFDGPLIHLFMKMNGKATAETIYAKAMSIIKAQDDDKFANMVYPSDRDFQWCDLYRICHFDNRARSTSLKALEFNMRMSNISDLPFPVGTYLNAEQIKVLKKYCHHDVKATELFHEKCQEQIAFREDLTAKHGRDFMNHSDVKIGKEIFQMELEKAGVDCYEYGPFGRQPRQTKRPTIALRDCIPSWIKFNHPEFNRVKDWLSQQVITETKGVFNDLTAHVGGLDFYFGTGGLHASVENEYLVADDEHMILDVDVTSLYPSLAITQKLYPAHLGIKFVEVYERLKEQRVSYKKGTAENAMLKLALNGVYGASGDKFSIFFDPLFTMSITLSGQMMIAMLAERLAAIDGVRLIQVNTDGITMRLPRAAKPHVDFATFMWEDETKLQLESVEYSKMVIRDVNNYIAVSTKGSVKRKGAYEWDIEWHQNASFLVVQKVAEKVLVEGAPIRETLEQWPDKYDFFGRVKVPRNSKLVIHEDGVDRELENTQRYYVSTEGGQLFKIMPPLAKKPDQWRRIGVESGWSVCPCNDIRDAVLPIDYSYYQQEIEKLCLGVM